MTKLTSRIQKGGALLADTRRLADVWDVSLSQRENLRRIEEQNLLGKRSRARAADVLAVLRPRVIEPSRQVMASLQVLRDQPAVFREACYYEATRVNGLLAHFAEGPLYEWYAAGRTEVTTAETEEWLTSLSKAGSIPDWSASVRLRVARGLLAALRDFGVLEGAVRKRIPPPRLSPAGLAYVAFREKEQGRRSSRAQVESAVWRRWLLDREQVTALFVQAASLGVLSYSQAGSLVRVDWEVTSLEAVARAAA